MRKILFLTLLGSILVAGCGSEGIFKVEETNKGTVSREDVMCLAEEPFLGDVATADITYHVGAQILESTYRRYKDKGYTDADFSRMPDSRLACSLKRLHKDLSVVLD